MNVTFAELIGDTVLPYVHSHKPIQLYLAARAWQRVHDVMLQGHVNCPWPSLSAIADSMYQAEKKPVELSADIA